MAQENAKSQVAETMLKQLKQPFDPKFLKWRVGATSADKKTGIALPYLDAREVTKRLDEVCGMENWQFKLVRVEKGFVGELSIKIDGVWVTKSSAGEDSNMSPIKGGSSDAFKRAAVMWGVGRYLYYLPQKWVAIKPFGKSFVLAEIPQMPDWALPNESLPAWEDVAELEAEKMLGDEAEALQGAIGVVDSIRDAETTEELTAILANMDDRDKVLFATEIATKQRQLEHNAKVRPANS